MAIFMQDGAPPHIETEVKQFLGKKKKKTLTNKRPFSFVELKDSICHEFSYVQLEMLQSAVNSVITRLQTLIYGDDGHIKQVSIVV